MRKKHFIYHKIALTIGLFLGITATGVSAKANLNQINNTNNSRQNNYINHDQEQNNSTTLLSPNQSNNNVFRKIGNLERNPQAQFPKGYTNQNNEDAKHINRKTSYLYNKIVSSGLKRTVRPRNSANYSTKLTQSEMRSERAHQLHHLHHHSRRYNLRHHFHLHYSKSKYHNWFSEKWHHYRLNHRRNQLHVSSSTLLHPVHHRSWFKDGLSRRNLRARSWVSWHESNHRWRVLSYGGVCVGYFQLNPHYLGYRHGHVNLNPKHQVKVADRYVHNRYGNWVNAKRFWEAHNWY